MNKVKYKFNFFRYNTIIGIILALDKVIIYFCLALIKL